MKKIKQLVKAVYIINNQLKNIISMIENKISNKNKSRLKTIESIVCNASTGK